MMSEEQGHMLDCGVLMLIWGARRFLPSPIPEALLIDRRPASTSPGGFRHVTSVFVRKHEAQEDWLFDQSKKKQLL